jgi:hypothetical protein
MQGRSNRSERCPRPRRHFGEGARMNDLNFMLKTITVNLITKISTYFLSVEANIENNI